MDYVQQAAHRAMLVLGVKVRLLDDTEDPIWGRVVEPTVEELAEPVAKDSEVVLVVQWSSIYRRWEYAEDLTAQPV